MAPSSSQVQDTGFSSRQHGFKSRWGHHLSRRAREFRRCCVVSAAVTYGRSTLPCLAPRSSLLAPRTSRALRLRTRFAWAGALRRGSKVSAAVTYGSTLPRLEASPDCARLGPLRWTLLTPGSRRSSLACDRSQAPAFIQWKRKFRVGFCNRPCRSLVLPVEPNLILEAPHVSIPNPRRLSRAAPHCLYCGFGRRRRGRARLIDGRGARADSDRG